MKKYARYAEYQDKLAGIKLLLIGMGIGAVAIIAIVIGYKLTHKEEKKSNIEKNVKQAVRVVEDVADEVVFGSEGEVSSESYITLKDVIDIRHSLTHITPLVRTASAMTRGSFSIRLTTELSHSVSTRKTLRSLKTRRVRSSSCSFLR